MTEKPDKGKGAPAGASRGNLEDFNEKWMARQLTRGAAGAVQEGRDAHATLASMIRESDLREPYRTWLAWMHEQIALGTDARVACGVVPRKGNFSKLRRDIALWSAIDRLAFEDSTTIRAAAGKLRGNKATRQRMKNEFPDFEMPAGRNNEAASIDTLVNIYWRIEKLRHE